MIITENSNGHVQSEAYAVNPSTSMTQSFIVHTNAVNHMLAITKFSILRGVGYNMLEHLHYFCKQSLEKKKFYICRFLLLQLLECYLKHDTL